MTRKLVTITGFAALTLLPLLQRITHLLPETPLVEKRQLTPAPRWADGRNLKTYCLGWQDWFNDHYDARTFLIRLRTSLHYSLFAYSDRVHIGKEGWLFYRGVIDGQKPAVNALSEQQIDQAVSNFVQLEKWLSARGIGLIVMDNHLADFFYPQNLPASVPLKPRPLQYEVFRQRMRERCAAFYFDPDPILHAIMPERPIFYKTDFHWNQPAAFVVTEHLVNRIAACFGPDAPRWRFTLEIEQRQFSGGEADFLPLLHPLTENALFIKPTWQDEYAGIDLHPPPPFEVIYRMRNDRPRLPAVVVYGNSFFDPMLISGFTQYFETVYRARNASVPEVLAKIPPGTKFFVFQFIEVQLGIFSTPWDFNALNKIESRSQP